MNKPANINLQGASKARKPSAGEGRAIRVLLAEDTPISAEAMKAMAQHLSFEMDHASNGVEAIEMVESASADNRPYALLLIDVMMPIIDGVEATKRLRAMGYDAQQLPIIAVTAANSFDEVRSYRQCGMQGFLAKPVSLADMRATLDAWAKAPPVKARSKSANRVNSAKKTARIEPALLETLRLQFHERNQHTLYLIETALKADDISPASIEEIRNLLHQIAGTAATFGDAPLSDTARAHENALTEAEMGNGDAREHLESIAHTLKQRIEA